MPQIGTGEAARILRVTDKTVQRWAASGVLPATRLTERGAFLFSSTDVEDLAAARRKRADAA